MAHPGLAVREAKKTQGCFVLRKRRGDIIEIDGPCTIRIEDVGGRRVVLCLQAPSSTVIQHRHTESQEYMERYA